MNNLEDIIKNKFSNYKQPAPNNVLESVKSNYPKPKPFIGKELIIAVSSIIIITATYLLLTNISQQEEKLQINKINSLLNPKYQELNIKEPITKEEEIALTKTEKTKYSQPDKTEDILRKTKTNFFINRDTVVCGNIFVLPKNIISDQIIIPHNLVFTKDNDKIYLKALKYGEYKVIYQNKTEKSILLDTIEVRFYKSDFNNLKILSEAKCPGEQLIVEYISNPAIREYWDVDGGIISKIDDKTYAISWLNPGLKNISLLMENHQCSNVIEKQVYIPEELSYTVKTKNNYCNNSNGEILIQSLNYENVTYNLNNIANYNGRFSNLNAGRYNIEIEYHKSCKKHKEILITDSIVPEVFFVREQQFSSTNEYYFSNQTRIDNLHYSNNPNIEFTWFINNKIFSQEDNAIYEFNKDGVYEIKLEAKISDNCVESFSDRIVINKTRFIAPNVFTPNDDGISDVFYVKTTEPVNNFHGIISSRTGEVVFEWRDIKQGWDGRIKGLSNASEGVYFYILRAEDYNGKIIEKKGTVQLIRD